LQTEETSADQEKKALEETVALAWLRQGQAKEQQALDELVALAWLRQGQAKEQQAKEQQLHLARQMPRLMDLAKQSLLLAKLVKQLRWTVAQLLYLPLQKIQTDPRHLEQEGLRQQKGLQKSSNNSRQPLSRSLEPVSQHLPVAGPQGGAQTLTEQQTAQHQCPAVPDTLKQHPRGNQSLRADQCS